MKNKSTPKRNSRRKWLISITVAIITIAVCFPVALEYYLQKKLPDIINEKTPYNVKIDNFSLSLWRGNVSVTNLNISTKKTNDNSIAQINGFAKRIIVSDIGILKAMFSKTYRADKIIVTDSDIKIKTGAKTQKDKKESGNVDFYINNISVKNLTADVSDFSGKPLLKGKRINILMNDIKQSKNKAKVPIAFSKINIDASNVTVGVNKFYEISAGQISTDNKNLAITSFHLKPLLDPALYNSKNVFDFAAEKFTAKDFMVSQDSLIVSDVAFQKPNLKVMSTGKNTVQENTSKKEVELKIGMKNIFFEKGRILVFQPNNEKTASVENFNFKLNNIVFDKNTVKEKIPFRFSNHDIEAENIYFKADALQAFKIAKISSKNSDIVVNDFQMVPLAKSNIKDVLHISTKQLKIVNNQSKFLGQKLQLNLGGIEIERPLIHIYSAVKKEPSKKTQNKIPEFTALVGYLKVRDGIIRQSNQSKEKMAVGKLNIDIKKIQSNEKLARNDIPFKIDDYSVNANNIHFDAGKYYNLKIKEIASSAKDTEISNLQYIPKYSRQVFSKIIDKETDLYTIKVRKISIKDFQSSLSGRKSIDLDNISIDGLSCNIYHDLAPPDDNAVRYMFSRKLRNMSLPLFIKKITIKNSELTYEENAENSNIPGKITFNSFNATIKNANNAKITGRPTTITTDAEFDFFGNAKTSVTWNFDVKDLSDKFAIKGNIQKLSAENVNLFVRPYLNVTLDGQIDYLKFDYYGNSEGIAGKFYFKYNDMYVNFLNKKGKERKLLTTIANWFVKNESTGEPDHVLIEKKREPERSFFNMLWQGIMEGLKKYVI
ncbi:hypothetical protein IX39_12230 [Chryseobacterium formosense]|uniref:DUF748 domain-containing protein n=1 Tax=Chryseobacterium formosense TaxID=236814 RepID=A0A085ZA75_9FLAO|nr:hypothetical protein [Chryseobacterium formosense]KFF01339.1 hypothetical protein IX39_12230 [Chryseobacterium formosense]SFT45854.1 hypothetical protein SAMN05421857_1134 [Chryseobacterium formosense]